MFTVTKCIVLVVACIHVLTGAHVLTDAPLASTHPAQRLLGSIAGRLRSRHRTK
jgi:hypothetical protein